MNKSNATMSKISIPNSVVCGVNLLYYINDAIPTGEVIQNRMRWQNNGIWKEDRALEGQF